ncbi:trans-resveratrol di-O-methyltransferase-like [Iris pallida]|uniref:Trans-resveratrol di-O-methyltransferase-like n=1 Tax=Iris pallida TaxID=29817 RepID=A0AAX6HTA4_IRIPA|nr:trans-resveratrol di-O-methyltransferase-like [Iris pallida]
MNSINGEALMQAQSHLWNHTFSFINSMALKCAVELAIPDAIHNSGNAITLSELSAALSIPPSRASGLRHLMRRLVDSGFFAARRSHHEKPEQEEEEDTFSLTTLSSILVKEKSECLSPFLALMLDQTLLKPWHSLGAWFKGDEPPTAFEVGHGMRIWDATGEWSEFNVLMNEGMESDANFTNKVLIEGCGELFRGLGSLVDVGGGTGSMARAVAEAFPEIKCTVFDLPHVVETFEASAAVEAVGGDFFKYIPPADATLLKWVLHDWNDQECVEILKRCRAAIPRKEDGGKVIIIEMVMNTDSNVHRESAHLQLLFDVHMMVHTTGKQRTERQWKQIFDDAGFSAYKILPVLGLRSVIEVYP